MGELIDQAQRSRAKKKEAKRRQNIMNGNIGSYSAILNGKKELEMVQDYNNLAVSIGMLNAEKDTKAKETAKKKLEEAAEKAKKKTDKAVEENTKRNKLMQGFQQELKQKDISDILALADARLHLYIRYFLQMKVVNLSKTKNDELQRILTPLLDEYYATEMTALGNDSSSVDIDGQFIDGHSVKWLTLLSLGPIYLMLYDF